jgi:hypothetical protein
VKLIIGTHGWRDTQIGVEYLMMCAALDKVDLDKQGLVIQFLHLRPNQHYKCDAQTS